MAWRDTGCGNRLILAGFLLAIGVHGWLFSSGVYALSADSSVRILNAWQWSRHPTVAGLFEATIPPPFYRLAMGTAMVLWPDPFWTPRAVTFVVGLAALAALCWLAHELFRSRTVVGLTAVIGAVLPSRALLALVPLAEIFYLTLVTAALAATMRWLRSRRSRAVMWAAILFALASTVRYEGWIFCAVFGIVVLGRRLRGRRASGLSWGSVAAIGAILVSFPAVWLLIHLHQHGSLEWITASTGPRFELRFGESLRRLLPKTLPAVFVTQNLASLQLLGLVSAALAWGRRRLVRTLLIIPTTAFVALSLLAVFSMAVPSHNFWRTPAAWSMLLVPFTAQLVVMQRRLTRRAGGWAVVAVTAIPAVVVIVAGIVEISRLTTLPNFVPTELKAARSVEKLMLGAEADAMVLIDSSRMRYYHIQTASRVADRFVLNTGTDPRSPSAPLVVDTDTEAVFIQRLGKLHIKYALFIDPKAKTMLDAHPRLKPIHRYGRWTLYQVLERRRARPPT